VAGCFRHNGRRLPFPAPLDDGSTPTRPPRRGSRASRCACPTSDQSAQSTAFACESSIRDAFDVRRSRRRSELQGTDVRARVGRSRNAWHIGMKPRHGLLRRHRARRAPRPAASPVSTLRPTSRLATCRPRLLRQAPPRRGAYRPSGVSIIRSTFTRPPTNTSPTSCAVEVSTPRHRSARTRARVLETAGQKRSARRRISGAASG